MRLTNLFIAVAYAALSVEAACPEGYTKTVVKFDDLKTGKKVPNKYPGGLYNWTGFEVFEPLKEQPYFKFRAASGKKAVRTRDLLGAKITYAPGQDEYVVASTLSAFSFGCLAYFEAFSVVDCDIGVISRVDQDGGPYEARGFAPISSTPRGDDNGIANLTRYEFPADNQPQGDVEFVAWRLPTYGQIVLDNIELCHYP